MAAAVDEIREIINGILKLQDKIMSREPWIVEEARENVGNVAHIEIYSLYGSHVERLKLDENFRIVRTEEKPKHVIRMHIDCLIDLILGERDGQPFDFGKAWTQGLIEFYGEDYITHAMKWSKAFERLRKYINMAKKGGEGFGSSEPGC